MFTKHNKISQMELLFSHKYFALFSLVFAVQMYECVLKPEGERPPKFKGEILKHVTSPIQIAIIRVPSFKFTPSMFMHQYEALEGNDIIMNCNLTKSSPEDAIQLLFWYKGEFNKPIYSVDARNLSNLKHFNYFSRSRFNKRSPKSNSSSSTSSINKQQAKLASRISLTPKFGLKIENLTLEESGFYRCRVDFRYARTLNTMTKLNVIVPAKSLHLRTAKGKNLEDDLLEPIDEFSDLVLECVVSGAKPAAKISWLYAETNNPIDDLEYVQYVRKLRTNSKKESQNSFFKLSSSSLNSVTSSVHTRWKADKFNITQVPNSPSNNISSFQDNHLRSSSILRIFNLTRDDLNRKIACQASNTNLTVPLYKYVTIDLNLRPLYVKILSVQRPLSANKLTSLVCQSGGSRPKSQINWYLDSVHLKSAREQYSNESNVTTSELMFEASKHHLGSILACKAHNERFPGKQLTVQWILDVFYKPMVDISIQNANNGSAVSEVVEFNELIFQCNVKCNPSVTQIGWFFCGKTLTNDAKNGVIIQNDTLIIKKSKRQNAGNYSCFAENIEGKTLSKSIKIEIKHSPFCALGQQTVYAAAQDETITVPCLVVGQKNKQNGKEDNLKFFWRLNDTLLASNLFTSGQPFNLPAATLLEFNRNNFLPNLTNNFTNLKTAAADINNNYLNYSKAYYLDHLDDLYSSSQFSIKKNQPHTTSSKTNLHNQTQSDTTNHLLNNNLANLNQFNHNQILESNYQSQTYHFLSQPQLYISKLNLNTKHFTFGILECWAENNVGIQEDACVYQIIPAGPPETPKNCFLLNETWYSFNVKCKPGFDGGFKQNFHLIAYETELMHHFNNINKKKNFSDTNLSRSDKRNFIFNLTNSDTPEFYLNQLKSGESYLLLIYATNIKGSSPFYTIIGQTVAMLRQSSSNEQVIKFDAYLATLIGFCFVFVLLILILLAILRVCQKAKSNKKANSENSITSNNNVFIDCNNEYNENLFDDSAISDKFKSFRTDTDVKKKFKRKTATCVDMLNKKLFEEAFDNDHRHLQFNETFIEQDVQNSSKTSSLLANLDQDNSIYLLDFQAKLINCETPFTINSSHLTFQNSEIYPAEATIAFSTPV